MAEENITTPSIYHFFKMAYIKCGCFGMKTDDVLFLRFPAVEMAILTVLDAFLNPIIDF